MVVQDRVGRTRRRPEAVRTIRLHVLSAASTITAALLLGVTAGTASAHGQADVCARAGLTSAVAVQVYGHNARVSSLPLIGYGPADLMNVPACFVYRPGNVLVATVQRYPPKSWSQLLAIYRGQQAHETPLSGLGPGSALFDVAARPGDYEEVVLFSGDGFVVAARPPLVASARPPVRPATKLLTLLRGVYARLSVS